MRPPICSLCSRDAELEPARAERGGSVAGFFSRWFDSGRSVPSAAQHDIPSSAQRGEWIEFADYEPLPEGMIGHPQGLEWFCGVHLPAAQALTALPTHEALQTLQGKYGASAGAPAMKAR